MPVLKEYPISHSCFADEFTPTKSIHLQTDVSNNGMVPSYDYFSVTIL